MSKDPVYKTKNYLRKPHLEKPKKYIPVELNYLTPSTPSLATQITQEFEKTKTINKNRIKY